MSKLVFPLLLAVFTACQSGSQREHLDVDYARQLREQLILADSGAVIEIPAGAFAFDRSISLDGVDHVTIRGAGREKTILSFAGQKDGAEGMLIRADYVTLEGFTIEDSKGDALKVQDARELVVRDVHTTWTGGAKETNGGYGIYPVSCTGVLIEHCEASYASDAGIYVGQSSQVVMRNNYAHHNVAGIEIENSRDVEAYENLAENNTGGLLIFDMPGLPQANGARVKVHHNVCRDNNHSNFAPEGGVVATLPPGTGMLIIAHRDVEVHDNEVLDYKTLGLGIISWYFTERPFDTENGFDPYYTGIYVHDNTFERKRAIPDLSKEFGQMINALFVGKPQDIVIDGIFSGPGQHLCLQNNGKDLRFVNLNASEATGLSDLRASLDENMDIFNCRQETWDVQNDTDAALD